MTRFFCAEYRGRRYLCAAQYPMRFAALYDTGHPHLWLGEPYASPGQAIAAKEREVDGKRPAAVVPMREVSLTEAAEIGEQASRDPRDFRERFDRRYPEVRPRSRAA